MPLRDHFHPPLSNVRHWNAFHSRWATALADALNAELLPEGYFAEPQVHVGSRVEIDVATFSESESPEQTATRATQNGGVATAARTVKWTPPAPALVMDIKFPDEIEVQVLSTEGGPTVVAAIELISPGNKDRNEKRQAFVSKCVSYLAEGIGLIIIDIVTSRSANLHNEIVSLLGQGDDFHLETESGLYAVAYRPWRSEKKEAVDLWPAVLHLEQALPLLPLALRGYGCLPIELEATYMEACRRLRLPE